METKTGLTREEYLRLLHAAKRLGRERIFFIMKLLCTVGVKIGELPQVTVELVRAGKGTISIKGAKHSVSIPEPLQTELLAYAARHGISAGTLFITRSGSPMNRTNICMDIKGLADAAEVSAEKCTPKYLSKLYQSTRGEIDQTFAALAEQTYLQMIYAEQTGTAWENE